MWKMWWCRCSDSNQQCAPSAAQYLHATGRARLDETGRAAAEAAALGATSQGARVRASQRDGTAETRSSPAHATLTTLDALEGKANTGCLNVRLQRCEGREQKSLDEQQEHRSDCNLRSGS
jgi:hypothetical protein